MHKGLLKVSVANRMQRNQGEMRSAGKVAGFTLIETIVGLVVLALSYAVISQFIFPAITRHADQLHSIRAAELGQSVLNEILTRAYDENSDHVSGALRCGDTANGAPECTAVGNFGPDPDPDPLIDPDETDSPDNYNDVDDYHGASFPGSDIDESYEGYIVDIDVCYDPDYDDSCDSSNRNVAKRVRVTVTTPLGDSIVFASYRSNF
ncbi:type IV pilus modification PilV family protein [Thalassotalea fusca]